ncbi:hypothetical protein [Urbifossiella limnaea]|uniref:SMI1/KNR4 family protein n=1 Tax=Urbifossiella limnaea TaxID=2528023 RepID=A0A517Y2N5_9BACT|nr:hypothetical protein [Urbifossiella limnaea]QDU23958.1 hypothetical protein ETAA1_59690 [Urbifossiella limnaea]
MNEADWMVATNPTPMLTFLRGKLGDRKLRLLGVAIARASWDRIEDDRTRRAVLTAEAFADGHVDASALEAVVNDAWDVRDELWDAGPADHDDRVWLAEAAALTASVYEWRNTFTGSGPFDGYPFRLPSPAHCDLIRDVFGNPFAPVVFDASWRTEAVVGLARGMYESRDFATMPVLADALEDAGCANADVLAHCRDGGPHVRGCWVVDLVLGKA